MAASIAALVAIRILALYLGVNLLVALPIVASIATGNSDFVSATYLLPYVLQLVAVVILWLFAQPLSRMLLKDVVADDEIPTPAAESIVRVVFVVFGVYLVATSIPSFASTVVQALENTRSAAAELSVLDRLVSGGSSTSQLAFGITRLVVGMAFLVGNAGFTKFVQRAKNFGLDA